MPIVLEGIPEIHQAVKNADLTSMTRIERVDEIFRRITEVKPKDEEEAGLALVKAKETGEDFFTKHFDQVREWDRRADAVLAELGEGYRGQNEHTQQGVMDRDIANEIRKLVKGELKASVEYKLGNEVGAFEVVADEIRNIALEQLVCNLRKSEKGYHVYNAVEDYNAQVGLILRDAGLESNQILPKLAKYEESRSGKPDFATAKDAKLYRDICQTTALVDFERYFNGQPIEVRFVGGGLADIPGVKIEEHQKPGIESMAGGLIDWIGVAIEKNPGPKQRSVGDLYEGAVANFFTGFSTSQEIPVGQSVHDSISKETRVGYSYRPYALGVAMASIVKGEHPMNYLAAGLNLSDPKYPEDQTFVKTVLAQVADQAEAGHAPNKYLTNVREIKAISEGSAQETVNRALSVTAERSIHEAKSVGGVNYLWNPDHTIQTLLTAEDAHERATGIARLTNQWLFSEGTKLILDGEIQRIQEGEGDYIDKYRQQAQIVKALMDASLLAEDPGRFIADSSHHERDIPNPTERRAVYMQNYLKVLLQQSGDRNNLQKEVKRVGSFFDADTMKAYGVDLGSLLDLQNKFFVLADETRKKTAPYFIQAGISAPSYVDCTIPTLGNRAETINTTLGARSQLTSSESFWHVYDTNQQAPKGFYLYKVRGSAEDTSGYIKMNNLKQFAQERGNTFDAMLSVIGDKKDIGWRVEQANRAKANVPVSEWKITPEEAVSEPVVEDEWYRGRKAEASERKKALDELSISLASSNQTLDQLVTDLEEYEKRKYLGGRIASARAGKPTDLEARLKREFSMDFPLDEQEDVLAAIKKMREVRENRGKLIMEKLLALSNGLKGMDEKLALAYLAQYTKPPYDPSRDELLETSVFIPQPFGQPTEITGLAEKDLQLGVDNATVRKDFLPFIRQYAARGQALGKEERTAIAKLGSDLRDYFRDKNVRPPPEGRVRDDLERTIVDRTKGYTDVLDSMVRVDALKNHLMTIVSRATRKGLGTALQKGPDTSQLGEFAGGFYKEKVEKAWKNWTQGIASDYRISQAAAG